MPPRFRICPICQQGFGTASLSIHIPQCYEKALKRWQLNPVGPMPVMPSTAPPSHRGQKKGLTTAACGTGANGVRSLNVQDNKVAHVPEYVEENMNLHPCSRCGRKFLFDRITYHESVCKGDVKRRVFQSSKQRAVGLDDDDGGTFGMSYGKKKKNVTRMPAASAAPSGVPRTQWREKHREFMEAMRAARRAKHDSEAMWDSPSPQMSSAKPDNRQRAPPAVMRHQKGMQMRQERNTQVSNANAHLPSYSGGIRAPPKRPYGNAFGGGGERFSSRTGGGVGGGGRILNDNTTSLGMLQAFGRA